MKFRLFVAVLAMCTGSAAIADFEIVTQVRAMELSPANMILPASTSGMMTYRPCADECDADYERARLTPETVYSVDGNKVKFDDFQLQFAAIKGTKSSYALLSVDMNNKTVSSIDIAR